jgi:hypothetical protein
MNVYSSSKYGKVFTYKSYLSGKKKSSWYLFVSPAKVAHITLEGGNRPPIPFHVCGLSLMGQKESILTPAIHKEHLTPEIMAVKSLTFCCSLKKSNLLDYSF